MSKLNNGQTHLPLDSPNSEDGLEGRVGIISRVLVIWLNPLLSLGYRRPLDAVDLPSLRSSYKAHRLHECLEERWQRQKASETNIGSYGLAKACLGAFGRPFYLAGFLKLIGDICGLSSPVILGLIITDLQRTERRALYIGVSLCFSIFALQMINTLAVNTYFTMTMQTGLRVRTAVSSLVYDKALHLSSKARQSFSTGQIVNLMSTDSSRLEMAVSYMHYIWSGPFQVIIILILLFRLLGWTAFIGFGALVIGIPIQSRITTRLSKYRKETSATTDKRVRLMQEIIQGIRVIKFYAWEDSFMDKLFDLREKELNRVRKSQTIRSLTVVLTSITSIFACIITLCVHYWTGHELTAAVVFPTMSLFTLLRLPLILLPMVISMVVDGVVAAKRLQTFLLAEELDFAPEYDPTMLEGVRVINGEFIYETVDPKRDPLQSPTSQSNLLDEHAQEKPGFGLENINLSIPRGSLTVIVGSVGSGKSSLLNALIGEMKCISPEGKVILGGRVAYCPQQAWIQNATVRENITFGQAYDSILYCQVVEACALSADFAMLPDGDLTEIGEKGVNLSGGQKQRISLARAAYANVEIVLLDDPLSAVDAHVGKHLLTRCINGLMAHRTRILVTHQLHVVPVADYVILLDGGRIIEQGSFLDLIHQPSAFANLMTKHGNNGAFTPQGSATPRSVGDENESNSNAGVPPSVLVQEAHASLVKVEEAEPMEKAANDSKGAKITSAEERVVGAVQWAVYKEYLLAAGGVLFISLTFGSIILWNITRVTTDYWIAMWTSKAPLISVTATIFIAVYLGLGGLQGIFAVVSSYSVAYGGVRAAGTLHDRSAQRVIHAPTSFFDTNPSGRIISRFSKDQDTLDNLMPETFRSFVHTFGLTIFTLLTMVIVKYVLLLPLVLLLGLYWYIQAYYRHTSRELKRLEGLSRSPLYAQFSETLTGLPTIRAFSLHHRFRSRNLALMNENNRAAFPQQAIQRWLGIRLESVGNLIILSSSLGCYLFKVEPSLAGLAIAYSLSVTGVMNWCIRQFADTEAQIISSERLGHYANKLKTEAPARLEGDLRLTQWPSLGRIEVIHLTMRYRADLPPVLNGVTFSVRPGERVGIVGRTGAGKSSIIMALFRMVEANEGSILVDGVDISTLGLATLRHNISIIPQDPVVFAGTVRWNLDPNGEHTDQALWKALEQSHLREAVQAMGSGLESPVHEGGDNLSVGQRQLLCLARAILRRNQILVLDEATANIDLATDALIQQCIRRDFDGCTILTIAHRISTVIDYDRILVMDHGCVVEYDSPRTLLSRSDSHFAALVRETGEQNEVILRSMIETA